MKAFVPLLVLIFLTLPAFADIIAEWDANPPEDGVTHYIVYEQTAQGAWTKVVQTSPVVPPAVAPTSVVLPTPTAGKHTYAVTAANIRGETPRSVSVTLPASASTPKNLRVNVTIQLTQ